MFEKPATNDPLRNNLDGAAGLLDLRLRDGARALRDDRELLGQLALAEDLHVVDELGHEALRAERLEVHRGARVEDRLERGDVDRERLDAVRILEAALRDP